MARGQRRLGRSWRRNWGVGDRFSENRATLIIAFAAIMLLTAIFFPRVYPAAKRGPECTNLASPLGGNNRSVLALSGKNQQNLDLKLSLMDSSIIFGQPLLVDITFDNKDIGPVILILSDANPIIILRPDQPATTTGVTFEITRVGAAYNRVNQSLPVSPGSAVQPDELHLLGSRARCTERFDFTGVFLQSAGLTPGDYRIRATYRNNNPGAREQLPAGAATPTATPAYVDQGIWVGEVNSNEEIFTVQ